MLSSSSKAKKERNARAGCMKERLSPFSLDASFVLERFHLGLDWMVG